MRLTSIESPFQPCDFSQGRTQGGQNVLKCAKMVNFRIYGLKYWETVEDRWVHAAMRLTSIDSSFHPCDIYRDCPGATPYGGVKCKAGMKKLQFSTSISLSDPNLSASEVNFSRWGAVQIYLPFTFTFNRVAFNALFVVESCEQCQRSGW